MRVCECVCVCPQGLQELDFQRTCLASTSRVHSAPFRVRSHSWPKEKERKLGDKGVGRIGRRQWQGQRACSSLKLSSYVLVSCAVGQGGKRDSRKETGRKGKKRKTGCVIPLYSKEEESEGGERTEGQLKLMEIYNNLKLTSHCHEP